MVELVWTPWALPALLAAIFTISLMVFVLWARPSGEPNRRLALQLFLEGYTVGLLGGLVWLINDPAVVRGLTVSAMAVIWFKLWTYFNFLATLDTPLARPIRPAPVRLGLLAVASIVTLIWFFYRDVFMAGVVPAQPIGQWTPLLTPAYGYMAFFGAALWLTGLTFAFTAIHHARTPLRRRQAKAYTLSFGVRDVGFITWAILMNIIPPTSPAFFYVFISVNFIWIIYTPLVGYAILRTQLFDIDVKLKWTVKRSTIAGAFLAAFFFVSEIAAMLLSQQVGIFLGITAASLLVFFLSPLQQMAGRIADAAMPNVQDTPDYMIYRKMEVYRAALEGALDDGAIDPHEHGILSGLRDKLGISLQDAKALEKDVANLLASPTKHAPSSSTS